MNDQISTEQQQIIDMYRAALPNGEVSWFRIDPMDHLGIPVAHVEFAGADGSQYFAVGYGETEGEALIGAFGEIHEKLQLSLSFDELPKQDASYRELCDQHGSDHVIDPVTLCLPAGSPYHEDLTLRWTTVRRLRDGADCWIPVEFVSSFNSQIEYANQLTTAITNGNGAGDTFERALLHGLLELLQRDGNVDCFRALDRGKVFDPNTLPPSIQKLLDQLREKQLEVMPKLARVTCGCVSLYAVGRDQSDDAFPLTMTGCGEAADMNYERALRKAILECAASHTRKLFYHSPFERKASVTPPGYIQRQKAGIELEREEQRALLQLVDWLGKDRDTLYDLLSKTVFLRKETVSTEGLPRFGGTSITERLAYVREQLEREGLEIYVFEATSTPGNCAVVKAIVPGIEMEFGSYHRLGFRGVQRLLADDPHDLLGRVSKPGTAYVHLTPEQLETIGGPVYLNTAKLDQLVDPYYPLYREPDGHAARYAFDTDYQNAEFTTV